MIKTVLVPASGSDTDAVVFETAPAAARPCRAHPEFFHLRVSSGEALRYMLHASLACGKGLHNALQELHQDAKSRSAAGANDQSRWPPGRCAAVARGCGTGVIAPDLPSSLSSERAQGCDAPEPVLTSAMDGAKWLGLTEAYHTDGQDWSTLIIQPSRIGNARRGKLTEVMQ
jgi:hypothetical protein